MAQGLPQTLQIASYTLCARLSSICEASNTPNINLTPFPACNGFLRGFEGFVELCSVSEAVDYRLKVQAA